MFINWTARFRHDELTSDKDRDFKLKSEQDVEAEVDEAPESARVWASVWEWGLRSMPLKYESNSADITKFNESCFCINDCVQQGFAWQSGRSEIESESLSGSRFKFRFSVKGRPY